MNERTPFTKIEWANLHGLREQVRTGYRSEYPERQEPVRMRAIGFTNTEIEMLTKFRNKFRTGELTDDIQDYFFGDLFETPEDQVGLVYRMLRHYIVNHPNKKEYFNSVGKEVKGVSVTFPEKKLILEYSNIGERDYTDGEGQEFTNNTQIIDIRVLTYDLVREDGETIEVPDKSYVLKENGTFLVRDQRPVSNGKNPKSVGSYGVWNKEFGKVAEHFAEMRVLITPLFFE